MEIRKEQTGNALTIFLSGRLEKQEPTRSKNASALFIRKSRNRDFSVQHIFEGLKNR